MWIISRVSTITSIDLFSGIELSIPLSANELALDLYYQYDILGLF